MKEGSEVLFIDIKSFLKFARTPSMFMSIVQGQYVNVLNQLTR
jgi:hypothetical protein